MLRHRRAEPCRAVPCHAVLLQGYTTHDFLRRMVLEDGRLPVPQDDGRCPLALRRLIGRCWSTDPSDRPHMDEVLRELERLYKYCVKPAGAAA